MSKNKIVSILVFVELALGLRDQVGDRIVNIRFQSLFSWNSLSDENRIFQNPTRITVSILVFVELALGPT